MNTEFQNIVSHIENSHYFDDERWFKDVLKTNYDVIVQEGFGIIIEWYKKFGKKVGYSRGGIRFNPSKKTLGQFNEFVDFLTQELKKLNYQFITIDHLEEENQFNRIFPKTDFRPYIEGTALIYPQENWIGKFNSKKRYDLLYAKKKEVQIKFFTNYKTFYDISDNTLDFNFEKFNMLVQETLSRYGNSFDLLSTETFKRAFEYSTYILAVAVQGSEWLCYNLSFINPAHNRVERVFAGGNVNGLQLRAPSYLEVTFVDYLYKAGVPVYDLWGTRSGDGYTNFKISLSDETVRFTPLSLITIDPSLAYLTIDLIKLANWKRNFFRKEKAYRK